LKTVHKSVAIVSLKGGVGKTTLAANIGAALAQRTPNEVLLVDLDPRNQLGLHFGMRPTERAGLAHAILRDAGWDQAARRTVDEAITWLPFGELGDAEHFDLERLLAQRPELLQTQLAERLAEPYRYVVFDTAAGPSPYFRQALRVADLVIAVLLADAASFATLPALALQLRTHCRAGAGFKGAHLLLNDLDALALSRDARTLVAAQRELPALPFVVHQDEAVRESLAAQRPVVEWAAAAQAAADFRQIAEWIDKALDDGGAMDRAPAQPRVAAVVPAASTGS
jgi:cellulose synthase operon protein YhjQ